MFTLLIFHIYFMFGLPEVCRTLGAAFWGELRVAGHQGHADRTLTFPDRRIDGRAS